MIMNSAPRKSSGGGAEMVNVALNEMYGDVTLTFSYYKADVNYAWTTEAITVPQYDKTTISIPKYSCLIIEDTRAKWGFHFPAASVGQLPEGVIQLFTEGESLNGIKKVGITVSDDVDITLG